MSERNEDAVAARIRALLSKTVENGATEAEAMSAAAKARELMDKHRLSMSDVEIQAEPIVIEDERRPNKNRVAAVDYAVNGIKAYCGVEGWRRGESYRFLGLAADVEMARYLYRMIAGAIKTELSVFQNKRGYRDRHETSTFQLSMAVRINHRLKEMSQVANAAAMTATGTALVVVKNPMVTAAYSKATAGFRWVKVSGMSSWGGAARDAGRAAGDRVNLQRPIGGQARGMLQ